MERRGTGMERRAGMMAFTELASSDPARTRRFLERAFNWKFDSVQMPMGEYLTSETPQGMTVGIRPTRPKEPPISTNYVLVDDLEDAEKKVRDLDGEIVLPKTDIPGMGKFFWFKIPNGPVMACWQDATETGDGRIALRPDKMRNDGR